MQSDNNDAMTIPSFSSIALSRALSTPPVYRPEYPDEDTLSDADADLSSFLFLFCVFMFIFVITLIKIACCERPRNRHLSKRREAQRRDYIRNTLVTKTVLKDSNVITEPDATKTTKNGSNERNNKADNNHHHHHHSHPKDTVKRNFIRQKTNLMLGDTTPAMTCPICLNEFSEGDIICWSHNPSCNHTFHMDCIEHWLLKHDRCPCCRNDYLTPAAAAAAAVDLPPPSNESRRRHLLLQLANTLVERMNRSPSGSHHSNSGRLPSSGHDRNPSDDLPSSRSDSERTTCISEEEGRHEQDPCCDIETGLCECRTSSAEDQ